MIVTLTVNPAIDRILSVDRLAFEDRAYIKSSRESAGGRGINASGVIHSFGGQTLAILISGGATGKRLEQHLKGYGFPFRAVPVQNRIRMGQGDRLGPVAGLTQDRHPGGGVDQDPEAAPDQRLVVGDDHADGHETACPVGMRASTRNPEAVGLATSLPP